MFSSFPAVTCTKLFNAHRYTKNPAIHGFSTFQSPRRTPAGTSGSLARNSLRLGQILARRSLNTEITSLFSTDPMPNVSNLVKTIQDIMRKDAGTYGDAQRLEQLGWMFFLKIFDDREREMELIRDNYRSPLPPHLRWSAWGTDEEGITGDALLDFVNNTLLPKLKSLTTGGDKITTLIRTSFEDANNYMKNGTLMRQVINKINGIDFNASDDRHMFGDIYE